MIGTSRSALMEAAHPTSSLDAPSERRYGPKNTDWAEIAAKQIKYPTRRTAMGPWRRTRPGARNMLPAGTTLVRPGMVAASRPPIAMAGMMTQKIEAGPWWSFRRPTSGAPTMKLAEPHARMRPYLERSAPAISSTRTSIIGVNPDVPVA